MTPVDPKGKSQALRRYSDFSDFFPLVASVLSGAQPGTVMGNRGEQPERFFVLHHFGFSQIFGKPDAKFDEELREYLVVKRKFPVEKLRLYTPGKPGFLDDPSLLSFRSERQRFRWNVAAEIPDPEPVPGALVREVAAHDLMRLNRNFSLALRFWSSEREFLEKGRPWGVFFGHQLVSVCYAAALEEGQAEIDVLTSPEFRRRGFGSLAVRAFLRDCQRSAVRPLWDCFTNNQESMGLCRKMGFVPSSDPYAFFTIPAKP